MKGTFINVLSVIIGSIIGTLVNVKIPDRFTKIIFQVIGIFTIYLGFKMALKSEHILIMIVSLLLGTICGELIDIDKYINRLGDYFKRKLKVMLFCMGSITIL